MSSATTFRSAEMNKFREQRMEAEMDIQRYKQDKISKLMEKEQEKKTVELFKRCCFRFLSFKISDLDSNNFIFSTKTTASTAVNCRYWKQDS